MKNIEQNFKNSLGNHELPYNATAWSSLSSKLDVQMPVNQGTAPAASKLKWIIGSSSVVVLSVVTYFLIFHNGTNTNTDNNSITNNDTPLENVSNERSNSKSNNLREDIKLTDLNSSGNTETETDNSASDKTVNKEAKQNGNNINITNESNSSSEKFVENSLSNDARDHEIIESDIKTESELNNNSGGIITIPVVQDVCEGFAFEINNTNEVSLVVSGSEVEITIPAKTTKTISIAKEGNYSLGTLNNEVANNASTFRVKRTPSVDFTIDTETKFENGLPTTKVNTDVIGESFEWNFNNQKVTGRSAAAHFYTKGDHNLKLTVTANNGCSATAIKSLYINKKYNLMAENAFVPMDNDPRNSTFMPYALTVRNANFTLIVLDPSDGHMVYKTNDSSQGWDGTDMKTGNPVAFEKSYVWKVVVINPEPNERNEYGGNIIPIRQK